MTIKKIMLFACAATITCGCTSYRFASEIPQEQSTAVKGKYRIAHITVTSQMGFNDQMKAINANNPFAVPDPWSIPQVASRIKFEDLKRAIAGKYPSVFVDEPSAMPIDIAVTSGNEFKEFEFSVLFPYLVSLGTLPAFSRTTSDCMVGIKATAAMSITSTRSVRLVSDSKLTVFSPFGLVSFDGLPNAVEQRLGSGIMSAPHIDNNSRRSLLEVFAGTVATATIAMLSEMEYASTISAASENAPNAKPDVAQQSVEAKLEIIQNLKHKGLITDEEYRVKKEEVLNSLH